MAGRRTAWLLAAAVLLGSAVVAPRVHGQVPANAAWQTIQSANFRVTYTDGLESLARRAAASAERAHAALAVLVAEAPRGIIDIVVTDNVDFSNGYAMPFPANRVVIYAKPPMDVLELQYTEDWIDLVVVHELAHIFHLDVAGPVGRALRMVLGRVPFSWPFFPAVGTPRWAVEGLAVGVESALTGAGRVHGSYNEMVVRTAILEGRMDDIDRLSAATPLWPGPARVYIHGSLFMDYLARRFGPDATARIVRETADAIIPPALWFGQVGRRALGVTFRTAYQQWQAELEATYGELAAELTAQGLTRGQPLTEHGAWALHPRFSPDGSAIAYAANDWRSTPRVRAIDAASGRQLWSRRVNSLAALAWLPGGAVLTSDLDFTDRFHILSDLHVLGGPRAGRPGRGERLEHPDASRDGRRAVAVQNEAGTNRLVLVDPASGALRPLTPLDEEVHWTLPRLSPDGSRIAAGRARLGGELQVVVLDTLGRVLIEVSEGPGISDAPAWSPDGRWLLFWSDRTGIPNLYAAEIGQMGGDAAGPGAQPLPVPIRPRLRQVTNTLTGAYHPDVSPDSRWIAFAAYGHDGFRIERMPFDSSAWRDPQPAAPHDHGLGMAPQGGHGRPWEAGHAHGRAVHAPGDGDAELFLRRIRDAVAAADTSAGPPRRYGALRHTRPFGWAPTVETGGVHDDFLGFWTFGSDLVDRHRWQFSLSASPSSGQTQGRLDYAWMGLPSIRGTNVHPSVNFGLRRNWDLAFEDPTNRRYIDEREDLAHAGLSLTHVRWRSRTTVTTAAELIRRSRDLHGFRPGERLRDPTDDLAGARGSVAFSTFVLPPFAISRENGVILQVTGRDRRDRASESFTDAEGRPRTTDGSYRELTTWNAGYLAFPLPGFARHVLAVRASGLLREGPGAGVSGIGGVSGAAAGFALPGFGGDLGGEARLLPVRGFESGARRGTRAWTASAEYRLPLALLAGPLRPLPLYADRLSAALFMDAGHAWCAPSDVARLPAGTCPSSHASDAPLLGAGAELMLSLTVYGAAVPLRAGVGVPLQGQARQAARGYFLLSPAF
jgi:hypothetical protein